MRDIPVFATELGVASLLLKDIPSNATAYIKIRSSMNIDQFLNECIDFCKSAGASYIYASGDDFLKKFPHKADVYLMRRDNFARNDTALLFPVQEQKLIAQAVPGAVYHEITSKFGHDGFLLENDQLTAIIAPLL